MPYLFKTQASFRAEVSRQAMETCEHVISEMGADLHDDLIQKLTVFRLSLDRLDRSKMDQAQIDSLIISLNTDFQEVVQSVRRISRRLLPVRMEDDSFQKALAFCVRIWRDPAAAPFILNQQAWNNPYRRSLSYTSSESYRNLFIMH